MRCFSFAAVISLALLAGACADEVPPARSPDSPMSTSAEEAPPVVAPGLSGRAAPQAPDPAGAPADPHAGHRMPTATANPQVPTATATSAPSAAPTHDHSMHGKPAPQAPAGGPK